MVESRLTQPVGTLEPKAERVAFHNARRLGSHVLMTNETGEHAVLSQKDYGRYLAGKIADDDPLAKELVSKEFFRHQLDFQNMAELSAAKNLLEWKGPSVHTVVVTLRCNFKCLYCHASVVDPTRVDKDMSVETAKKTVDLIFESRNPTLMIEFQGGEPLLNWPVIKFIVGYARKKNAQAKRILNFGLISNFSLLEDQHIEFAAQNGVSFCTSLDGPSGVHNKNRVYLGGNTHAQVVANLKKIQDRRKAGLKLDAPNAICTVTRASLPFHREIVDQLVELGIERVQLGPLDPVGFARKSWPQIGITSAEFVEFYAKSLDYLIALNRKGVKAYEKMALIFLIRILEGGHWRFPNADAVCRLAYNHDGSVYTGEDARLLANEGDPFFRIGDVSTSSLPDLLDHPTVRASLFASNLASQPQCSQCAYNPYCSVLPVYNYETQGSLWGQMPSNGWCEKMMGIFDVLFERLQDPASRTVLESWLEYKNR
ncbi:MAG: His-Xaa-Ser system radical SAM maturase HxsB [Elusimicrobia bacterium]|nr:His-Xaa-Ser system radical SAM maturase HxsB [Elusimicrobiota bacterium]